jgi:hypothetical protein
MGGALLSWNGSVKNLDLDPTEDRLELPPVANLKVYYPFGVAFQHVR